MTHEKFPFGKYAGILMNDLDSTYIVHALESFELSDDLKLDLLFLLDKRFKITRNNYFVKQLDECPIDENDMLALKDVGSALNEMLYQFDKF